MPGKQAFFMSRGKKVYIKPKRRTRKTANKATQTPARFNASRSQYIVNKAVSKVMNKMSENKLLALTDVNPGAANGTPSNIVGAGSDPRVYAWRAVLDTVPTGWDTGLVALQGIRAIQGDSATEHVGNYVYLKKTSVNVQLDMVYNDNATKQLQFRMIVCKSRQLSLASGTQDFPQTTLFINQIGNRQGYSSTSSLEMAPFEVMNNPINKRNWVVYRDSKFFLNNPTSMQQGKYPSRRNFRLTLPHYKKTKVTTAGEPLDYDSKYLIFIFATVPGALTNAVLPDDFRVAIRGTTSYTDN
jgi:hypothetical protein